MGATETEETEETEAVSGFSLLNCVGIKAIITLLLLY